MGSTVSCSMPLRKIGAMENWALLTFRETALLWNAKVSSAYDKMRVASVLAHEMSHMVGNQLILWQLLFTFSFLF